MLLECQIFEPYQFLFWVCIDRIYSLVSQMKDVSGGLGAVNTICAYISIIAGLFLHAVLPPFLVWNAFIIITAICVVAAI